MTNPAIGTCEDEGHDWRFIGQAEDGTTFYRCRRCGAECER